MKKVILTSVLAAFVLTMGTVYAQDNAKKDATPAKKEVKKEVKKEAAPVKKEATAVKNATPANPAQPVAMPGTMGKGPSVEERATQSVTRIGERVKDLNADQKKKLTETHIASFKQAEIDKELSKTDMEKYKEASKARVLKLREDIQKIMTPEQWKTYTTPPPRPEQKPTEDKKVEPKK